jgi:hypothetical protein
MDMHCRNVASATVKRSDEITAALQEVRREIVGGLMYTHSPANANTSRALETAIFLYTLIELLAEKDVLTTAELESRKDTIADRVQKRFLSKGMGVVLQEPEVNNYAAGWTGHTKADQLPSRRTGQRR